MNVREKYPSNTDTVTPISRRGIGIGIGIGAMRLGDIIKALTKMLGIKPCAECEKRAEKLNSFVLPGRTAKKRPSSSGDNNYSRGGAV